MAIQRHRGVPLYHQLKEIFIGRILSGEWKPGERIPSEIQLCEEFGVSRRPVKEALDQLEREGLIANIPGEDARILPRKIERDLGAFYSFTSLIEQRGMRSTTELISFNKIRAEGGAAIRWLNLQEKDQVYKIRRLRYANDEPMVLETIYVPVWAAADLDEEILQQAPLYTTMRERYNIPLVRARQFFEPVVADEFEAEVLGIHIGAPVLLLQNITYTENDRAVILSKNAMRGDRVRYFVELTAPVE